ncbi:MAG: hypothetical protein WC641_06765 [Patescibacteria group bacterium]
MVKQIQKKLKILSKLYLAAMAAGLLFSSVPVGAAGVTVTLTPSSSSSSPQDVAIAWTGSAVYATGTTITITTSPAFTSIATGTTQTLNLDTDGFNDGFLTSTTTNTVVYTIATSTTLTSNILHLLFTFPSTAQNYSISVFSSNPVDIGSALLYANSGNLVTVTAQVPAILAFAIRNSADSANTNVCNLGTLTSAASSTCGYRLKIGTNATNGFTASIAANRDLATGYATMTQVVDNAASAPGSEQYGLELFGATEGGRDGSNGYTGAVTEANVVGFTFQTDNSPVPTSTKNFVTYTSSYDSGTSPDLTNTTLVKHFANIHTGTPAGNYSQVVTYTVTATF